MLENCGGWPRGTRRRSSAAAEITVLLSGTETAAETAAERLVRAVAALDVPGLSAAPVKRFADLHQELASVDNLSAGRSLS